MHHQSNKYYRYIRSHIPLDDLERRARFPVVDLFGREYTSAATHHGVAGAQGEWLRMISSSSPAWSCSGWSSFLFAHFIPPSAAIMGRRHRHYSLQRYTISHVFYRTEGQVKSTMMRVLKGRILSQVYSKQHFSNITKDAWCTRTDMIITR